MSLDVGLFIMVDTGGEEKVHFDLFDRNITHNLNKMAGAAGIYEALWHPEELNATVGGDLIEVLSKGLRDMKSRPNYYKQYDSPNGWGIYDDFIPFIEAYLQACVDHPKATIWICG